MSNRLKELISIGGLVLAVAALAGCASSSDRATRASLSALETPTPEVAPGKTEPTVKCGDPTASLRPSGALPTAGRMPAGSFMRTIERRGRLIAGVDQNTLLFAYLNPFTASIQGFEIDLLRQVAKAIFGDPTRIRFEAIKTTDRLPFIQQGRVDIVADAYTINCYRIRKIDFSSVYYDAGQRLLVPKSSHVLRIGDLAHRQVCVTKGTAYKYLVAYSARHRGRHPIPHIVPQRTDCLAALQQGRVAAILSDDAILLGFAKQDPYAEIVGPRLTDEPYGMGISKRHPEFVRFVNAVLARARTSGTWSSLYTKWLGSVAPPRQPPHVHYRG